MSKRINKKGFTLIEVVLVIAIGALIFLLAFIAFGNAQTNRKDSQRRTALDTMAAEIENYKSDRNGSIPPNVLALKSYVSSLKTPDNKPYTLVDGAPPATPATDSVYYQLGTTQGIVSCKGTAAAIKDGGWKIELQLQKGIACRDSETSS